jgi:uracil-DNA glycosylase
MGAMMEAGWLGRLEGEFRQPYMEELARFLGAEEAAGRVVYPPFSLIFNAFCQTRWEDVKAVVVGQDPYHGEGQAHGLSFSVPRGVAPPPSLQNIYKELEADLGIANPKHGCLEGWARQGVLLLNATLTVRANEPKSHYGRGWEKWTDRVIQLLVEREDPIVFVLWGKSAMEKLAHVPRGGRHLILSAPHPSPFSASSGFFGCRHFSQINRFLQEKGKAPIDWNL